jgi:hypothetical protein
LTYLIDKNGKIRAFPRRSRPKKDRKSPEIAACAALSRKRSKRRAKQDAIR